MRKSKELNEKQLQQHTTFAQDNLKSQIQKSQLTCSREPLYLYTRLPKID